MGGDSSQADGMVELLKDLFDPGLTAEQSALLRRQLMASPEDRERYVRYVTLHSMLESQTQRQDERLVESLRLWKQNPTASLSDAWVLPAIRSDASTDRNESGLSLKPAPLSPGIPASTHSRRKLLAAAIGIVGVGLAALLAARFLGPHQVGTIEAVANAQWEDASQPPASGTAIIADQEKVLQAGCVQFKLTGGARVTVEAPARFAVESGSSVLLSSGKIAAFAPGGGFTVHCPHATLVDLGTQFGVDVGSDGDARVEVFQGSVRAEVISGSSPTENAQVLTAGQAADVSTDAVKLDSNGSSPQHFVLALSTTITQLDLTDLVCGGDGTTGLRGRAVDVSNGSSGLLPQIAARRGDHLYHRVPQLPAVDGCFVPDGASGPMQVDSAGDTYHFAATSNRTAQLIWAGGTIPDSPDKGDVTMKSTLAGVDYSGPGHGFLALHCNKGLTLDLEAIRRLYPKSRLDRFHCVIGNTSVGMGNSSHRTTVVIIVDGNRRFRRGAFSSTDGGFPADVQLRDTDRFLTLATLEAGDGTAFNWVLFGDPVITLTPNAGHVGD